MNKDKSRRQNTKMAVLSQTNHLTLSTERFWQFCFICHILVCSVEGTAGSRFVLANVRQKPWHLVAKNIHHVQPLRRQTNDVQQFHAIFCSWQSCSGALKYTATSSFTLKVLQSDPAECSVPSEERRQHQGPRRRRRQDYRGDAGEDKWGDGWTTAPASTLVLMDFAGKRLKRPTWKGWSQATQRAFPSHFIYVYERQIKCKWSEWAPRWNKQSLDCWNHNVSSLEREILYMYIIIYIYIYMYIEKSHQMPARLLVVLCLHTAAALYWVAAFGPWGCGSNLQHWS